MQIITFYINNIIISLLLLLLLLRFNETTKCVHTHTHTRQEQQSYSLSMLCVYLVIKYMELFEFPLFANLSFCFASHM
jgi:hypothetical protein